MGLSNSVVTEIAKKLIGQASTDFDNANAYVGVGNGTTALSATHNDLQGASKLRKGMDATFPTRSGDVLTFSATFGDAEANFAWEEYGIFNASSAGTMMIRDLASLGTKPSNETWVLEVDVTLTN